MTTPPSALPPANWYPDPQTPGQLRYWDGQRWTQHVHPLEQPAQGTSGFAPQGSQVAQGSQAAQGSQSQGYQAQGPQTAGNPMAQAAQSPANTYTPIIQASPITASQPHVTPGARAAGPATGGLFPATGATGVQPGGTVAAPGMLQAPTPRNLDDEDDKDSEATAPVAALSIISGVAAIGVAALAVFNLVADYDEYLPYVGAGLGFLAVFLGFLGRKRASAGFMGGTAFAWSGIGAGFLAMLISTYEFMHPGELYTIYNDYIGG